MLDIAVAHSLSKIRRHDPFPPPNPTMSLRAPRNGVALGQVVIRSTDPVSGLPISAAALRGDPEGAALPVELAGTTYIEVQTPTTPAFEPGWYPDAIPPLDGNVDLPANVNQSLWLRVRVPDNQPAGTYGGNIAIDHHVVPVSLEVWDVTLPQATHCRTAFAIWYDQVAAQYGVPLNSAEGWELAERFYWFQVDHRLPPDDLPLPANLDATEWLERATPYLSDPRVTSFRIPFCASRPERTYEIVAGLRARGWLDRGYFYLDEIDEPTAGGTSEPAGGEQRVHDLCRKLAQIAPEVPHLVTAEPVPELSGSVRTWVPLFDRYEPDRAAARSAAGERFWWYGCVYPTHPYPTYHIDDDLMAARIVPWMMHRYGIDGNLYWSTTVYQKWAGTGFVDRDPWADPIAWPGANGDGCLIYPGPAGPVPSLRLEAIRAGQEDYELLRLLEQAFRAAERQDGERLDVYERMRPYYDRMFSSTFEFTRDPQQLDEVRAAVVAQLLQLSHPQAGGGGAAEPPALDALETAPPRQTAQLPLDPNCWYAHRLHLLVQASRLVVEAEPADDDRPHLRWSGEPDLRDHDVVEFEVDNPTARSFALYVTFHQVDRQSHEAARVMAVAGEQRSVRVPVSLALMKPQVITGVEIGVMHHQPPAHLVISDVRVARPVDG